MCLRKNRKNANTEKEQMETKSSAKVLCVVGISQDNHVSGLCIILFFILLGYRQMQVVNMRLLTLQKFHVFCVVLYLLYSGNFITKAKRNAVVGVRTVWRYAQ